MAAVVASSIALSWLAMQAVHEAGHVLHAWLSGGSVARVVLDPLELSRTEFTRNPRPLFVAWGGVLWGSGVPAVLLVMAPRLRPHLRQLGKFFAGFCLVANGVYLLGGTLTRAGDPGDLIRFGTVVPLLVLMGLAVASAGLLVWHRLGPGLGFAVHASPGSCRTACVLAILLVLVFCLTLGWSR